MQNKTNHILIVGAGIGGLTTGALLAHVGYKVTILEGHTYPGGCAGTFYHQGYRFEAGATVAGGFQPGGPHAIVADLLEIAWPVRQHEPAWVVHLPDQSIELTQHSQSVLSQFPETESFWQEQSRIADLGWRMSAEGLPWPPGDMVEWLQLAKVGIKYFPHDLRMLPFAFNSVYDWAKRHKLQNNPQFIRFLDAQLLIAAQTTSQHTNALYGATALDLPRQGVFHVEGGIGGLAQTLADKFEALGGELRYRHNVTRIQVENKQAIGVFARKGKRNQKEEFIPADFVIGNLTPWSLNTLLGQASPKPLSTEVKKRPDTWGAFALHLGVERHKLPINLPEHHQIITEMDGPLGEGRSIFISISPEWDRSRAPEGHRAVTITTHTRIQPWWDLLEQDYALYESRKASYTERILNNIDSVIPGFSSSVDLTLPGTPVTYDYYTGRHAGMVGGFPQTSLFKARGPKTGIANLRLVGDSIFPGQSTAGVTLGAIRVAKQVERLLPVGKSMFSTDTSLEESNI